MRLRLTYLALFSFAISGCNGGGVGPKAAPTATPTATPTAVPTPPAAAYVCPTSASTFSAARGGSVGTETVRRSVARARSAEATAGLIAVTYDRATAQRSTAAISSREQSLGARVVQQFDFPHTGVVTRILSVEPAQAAGVQTALRSQAGVRSVGTAGGRRYPSTIATPYYPNDPYFNGFTAQQGAVPASYHVLPYSESASVPGQWDMHAIGLESAFAYSQSGNGSGITNAAALGSPSVKIAVIDTGVDSTHPDLHAKIAYQKCFITSTDGVTQSTSNYSTDPTGHGTDVAGIASAALGNGLGFVGAGGNTAIYAYRIFPTPDDNCASSTASDAQCSAATADIASAITDAIAQHVNVINLSLGGGTCDSNGVDSDHTEGNAIAEAIAANVIVVASSGNGSAQTPQPVEAPACVSKVIAVGATSLGDGVANGSGASVGAAASPVEYVASYSNYGSPAKAYQIASAWGIVAPGGDPSASDVSAASGTDDLHWIENVWTSTPYQSSPSDLNFVGSCTPDFGAAAGSTADCRTLIAGTSMSAPHVAGAAALILSVNPAYQSPDAMKALLCSKADDIGDPHEGCGRLNVYRAMATALADPHLP